MILFPLSPVLLRICSPMAKRRLIHAVNEALHEEMERDDRVILYGEDVRIGLFGVNTRSGLGSTARARMVPVVGSTWLSTKSTVPSCGKPVSLARPMRTGLLERVRLPSRASSA